MDFWDLTKLLFRRWYFSVPMLLLAVAVTFMTGTSVKPDYQATGHLQLIPSASAGGKPGDVRNPWAELPITAIGDAAIVSVNDQRVLKGLAQGGFTGQVASSLDGRSPIITVQATGRSRQQASATVREMTRLIEQSVASLQQSYSVPSDHTITVRSLDAGENIDVITSRVKRALAAIGGASLLLTAGVTVGLDALLSYWSRRRSVRRARKLATRAPGAVDRDEEEREVSEALPGASPRNASATMAMQRDEAMGAAQEREARSTNTLAPDRPEPVPRPRRADGDGRAKGRVYRRDAASDDDATITMRRYEPPPPEDRGSADR